MPDDPQRWLTLTTRYGKEIDNPSKEDMSRALDELRTDNHAGMTEADYAEHSCARLRSETDAGPNCILSVNRDGTTSYSEFVSQEADDPVVELTKIIPHDKALALWIMLAEGNTEKVEAELADNH